MEARERCRSESKTAFAHGWCPDRTRYQCADAATVTARLEDATYKLKYHSLPDRRDATGRLRAPRYGIAYQKADGSDPVVLVSLARCSTAPCAS